MKIPTQLNIFGLFVVILLAVSLVHAQASDEVQQSENPPAASVDEEAYREAVVSVYGVDPAAIDGMVRRGLPLEDVPVALQIARAAAVAPTGVVEARLAGSSWQQAAAAQGLGAETFYQPVSLPGPAFEKALQPFAEVPRSKWSQIRLDDDQVRLLVNLRFLTEANDGNDRDVVRFRNEGIDFVTIHSLIRGGDQLVATQC